MNNTITITFGDQSENHVNMQRIGTMAEKGFSVDELKKSMKLFEAEEVKCELVELDEYEGLPEASVLIVRQGINCLLKGSGGTEYLDEESDDMFKEQNKLNVDKHAFMYGRVVNKNARHNLCFDHESQEPDYANKKGRIVAFRDVPITDYLRKNLSKYFGEKAERLTGEGNYYYDSKKCGIGFHGDSERKIVIAARLGASIPLCYQWYYKGKKYGDKITLELNHGDLYVMSEKAVGTDWKRKLVHTLRHAAGCPKYTA